MSQYLKIKSFKKKSYRRKIRPHGPVVLGIRKLSAATGLVLRTDRAVVCDPAGVNRAVLMAQLIDAPFKQHIRKQVLTKGGTVTLKGQEGKFMIISRCTTGSILLRKLDE